MDPLPLCVTDAPAWGNSASVKVAYDFTSPDGTRTIHGTSTVTWARQRLADLVKRPKLRLTLSDFGALSPDKGKFIAVQNASGKLPGWLVLFGPQDATPADFTVVTTYPGQPPQTTHTGALVTLAMTCALVSPGRAVGSSGEGVGSAGNFPSLNNAYSPSADGAQSKDGATYAMDLLRAGQAATRTAAAVGALYRLTLPDDTEFAYNWTVNVNGAEVSLAGDYFTLTPSNFTGDNTIPAGDTTLSIYQRTPFVFDLLTGAPGDVLGVGHLDYVTSTQVPSTATAQISLEGQGGPSVTFELTDPFTHGLISYPKDDNGLSLDLTF